MYNKWKKIDREKQTAVELFRFGRNHMMRSRLSRCLSAAIYLVSIGLFLADARGAEVPRMSPDELRMMLGNPEVVIIDVRIGESWENSPKKIKGAIREDPNNVESWADKYRRDMTVVLY